MKEWQTRLSPGLARRKAPDWGRSPGRASSQAEIGEQVSNKGDRGRGQRCPKRDGIGSPVNTSWVAEAEGKAQRGGSRPWLRTAAGPGRLDSLNSHDRERDNSQCGQVSLGQEQGHN